MRHIEDLSEMAAANMRERNIASGGVEADCNLKPLALDLYSQLDQAGISFLCTFMVPEGHPLADLGKPITAITIANFEDCMLTAMKETVEVLAETIPGPPSTSSTKSTPSTPPPFHPPSP